ncbi:MAG: DMT family transporter [Hyphomicrobiales bacterium]|nr:DMT family transporter [Hyphomicrobiales bacterium]
MTRLFNRAIPLTFVLIWSTGWIVARYAADFGDPLTFLLLRYVFAGTALLALAIIGRAAWPKNPSAYGHAMLSGVMLHALYLGGVWWAIRHGVPASVSALIAAVQPILTTVLAPLVLGETITARRWLGVAIGVAGLLLVLLPGLAQVDAAALSQQLTEIGINVGAMVAVTCGSFYQKKFVATGDLRTTTILQYTGAALVTLPVAFLLEPMHITWNLTMVLTMAWSVLALSLGAISLYLILIRRGEVSQAAQLIFLVPPTASVQAWLLFGEKLSAPQLLGMALTALGVALASRT